MTVILMQMLTVIIRYFARFKQGVAKLLEIAILIQMLFVMQNQCVTEVHAQLQQRRQSTHQQRQDHLRHLQLSHLHYQRLQVLLVHQPQIPVVEIFARATTSRRANILMIRNVYTPLHGAMTLYVRISICARILAVYKIVKIVLVAAILVQVIINQLVEKYSQAQIANITLNGALIQPVLISKILL